MQRRKMLPMIKRKKQSTRSKNDHILKLEDENFKRVIINMLKDFRKREQKEWQVENISLEMQTWKKNQKEIPELKNSVKVRVAQPCPILCDPTDCSFPGSSVRGIHQIRMPEWAAIPFSTGSSQPRDQTQVSHTAGRFFTVWATKEAENHSIWNENVTGQN